MKVGFKVIDADRHVLKPSDLFETYLPEKFRSRVQIKVLTRVTVWTAKRFRMPTNCAMPAKKASDLLSAVPKRLYNLEV